MKVISKLIGIVKEVKDYFDDWTMEMGYERYGEVPECKSKQDAIKWYTQQEIDNVDKR